MNMGAILTQAQWCNPFEESSWMCIITSHFSRMFHNADIKQGLSPSLLQCVDDKNLKSQLQYGTALSHTIMLQYLQKGGSATYIEWTKLNRFLLTGCQCWYVFVCWMQKNDNLLSKLKLWHNWNTLKVQPEVGKVESSEWPLTTAVGKFSSSAKLVGSPSLT